MAKNNFATLNSKVIGEKEFTVEFKGYKVEEVDSFLDAIMEDYFFFEGEIERKDKENEDLKLKLERVEKEFERVREGWNHDKQKLQKLGEAGEENKMILSRINNLEKRMPGK